jgi:hypothetical protein
MVGGSGSITAVGILACLLPAQRAARLDPLVTPRQHSAELTAIQLADGCRLERTISHDVSHTLTFYTC